MHQSIPKRSSQLVIGTTHAHRFTPSGFHPPGSAGPAKPDCWRWISMALVFVLAAVLHANDAPVAVSQSTTASLVDPNPLQIWLGATDPEASPLTYRIVQATAHGTLDQPYAFATNYWTYTPTPGFTGADAFTFVANDGVLDSNIATVSIAVVGNNLPVAMNEFKFVIMNRPERFLPLAADKDVELQAVQMTLQIVSPPAHGTLASEMQTGVPIMTYTPNHDYTGDDTVIYRLGDGLGWSPPATCSFRVRRYQDRGQASVALIVPQHLYQPQSLKPEIDRLIADMTAEGFRPILSTWSTPQTKDALYDYLRTLFVEPGRFLVGATIFGDYYEMPEPPNSFFDKADAFAELAKWNDIYISRIGVYGPLKTAYGEERFIRQHLDMNHLYRTGKVRLPWHAMKLFGEEVGGSDPVNAPADHPWRAVWDNDTNLTDDDVIMWDGGTIGEAVGKAFSIGGQFFSAASHGSGAANTLDSIPVIVSCKFACFSGGQIRYWPYGRSGCLIASPGSDPGPEPMLGLKQGDYWGRCLKSKTGLLTNGDYPDMIQGDLTLRLMMTPDNEIPRATLTSEPAYAYAGIPVEIRAAVRDDVHDDNPERDWKHAFEWYDSPNDGLEHWINPLKVGTDQQAGSDRLTMPGDTPYSRNVLLRVEDEWHACSYTALRIQGRPNPAQPFRIDVSESDYIDGQGRTWWHGQSNDGWGHITNNYEVITTTSPISGSTDPRLYQEQFRASINELPWSVPVANGSWRLRLHFAAIDPNVQVGQQLADITVEGVLVRHNLDILATAGRNAAYVIEIPFQLTDGMVNLDIIATGSIGPDLAAIELIPDSAVPTILKSPSAQTVVLGATATFSAVVSALPTATLQWQRLIGGTWTAIAGATSSTYATPAIGAGDDGAQFRVVATNMLGTATSAAATVTVSASAVAPAIVSQPTNTAVAAGANASFTVVVSGSPVPALQWERNVSGAWTAITGASSTTYTVATVIGDNDAQFRVVATNSAGVATSSPARLTVTSPGVRGDLNNTGTVTFEDLALFLSSYGTNAGDARYLAGADLVSSGSSANRVDFEDLASFLSLYHP